MQLKATNSAMKWTIALLVSGTLVSGCATTGGGSACAGWKPIRMSAESVDGLTLPDAQDILAHNEYGVARGCW